MDGKKPACLFGSGPGVLGGESAAGDQAVQVRMVHKVLAPGVEDGGDTQFSLEALLAKLQQCGAGAGEQCLVEGALILQDQRAQRCRQGEDPVETAPRQQRAALALGPVVAALMLTCGASPDDAALESA